MLIHCIEFIKKVC